MHVHVSALNFLIHAAYTILTLAGLLWIAATFADRPIGQAAAALTNG